MKRRRIGVAFLIGLALAAVLAAIAMFGSRPNAREAPLKLSLPKAETDAIDEAHTKTAQKLINGGLRFLLSKRDAEGGWNDGLFRPATTSLVAKALIQHPDFNNRHPVVRDAVNVLMRYRHDDGGFYDQGLQNYTTSIVVMALVAADDPRHEGVIAEAVKFLKGIQIRVGARTPAGKVITKDHPMRGGTSYGEHGRPDLSNLGMTVEAWRAAGVPADDEAMQEALIFLERVQNKPWRWPEG